MWNLQTSKANLNLIVPNACALVLVPPELQWIHTSYTSHRETLRMGLICLHKNTISNSEMTYFLVNYLTVRVDLCVSKVKQLTSEYWCWGTGRRFDDFFKKRERTCWFKAFKKISKNKSMKYWRSLWRAALSSVLPLRKAAVLSGG